MSGVGQAEAIEDELVEALLLEHLRHLVDARGDVLLLDDGLGPDVAEERELGLRVGGQGALRAADQDVGRDADLAQAPDGVLAGLRLQLAAVAEVRDVGEVADHRVLRTHVEHELPDGLQEVQALDVADRAAQLADQDVGVAGAAADRLLDLVGDVRDHLDRLAQVVAAALLGDDRGVDLARRVVAVLGEDRVGEALVVPEVEVGLGPVLGHVDLAVLEGRHGPRVDVDVGVQLLVLDLEAVPLQQHADARAGEPLAQARDHAAGHEDVLRHAFVLPETPTLAACASPPRRAAERALTAQADPPSRGGRRA